ncbi:uncharacterized protein LOC110983554 [Acanthaster planci]|uniref:Uncharacterized protein LOC110983554 n=1 Tax=Acanthaster planci TaxID=133434 RepID=A0A8B7Z0T3_ACAPL|nr:uncharacterized protein LOC110983554 [Acanthaster planci]
MNMKVDSLLVVCGMVWLVLLVAILTDVSAKPLNEPAELQSRRPRHRLSLQFSRTVPDFVAGALDQLHHREKRFPRVPMGSPCNADSQCPGNYCCAMKLGKAVCMPRLVRGRTCMINGPQAYSPHLFFTQCPCNSVEGLSCQRVGHGNRGICS